VHRVDKDVAVHKSGLLACMISLHLLQKLIANGAVACQFAYLSLHACVTCYELLRNFEQFSLSLSIKFGIEAASRSCLLQNSL